MGDRLINFLTRELVQKPLKLRTEDISQKVKADSEIIKLNAHGWYAEKKQLTLTRVDKQSQQYCINSRNRAYKDFGNDHREEGSPRGPLDSWPSWKNA